LSRGSNGKTNQREVLRKSVKKCRRSSGRKVLLPRGGGGKASLHQTCNIEKDKDPLLHQPSQKGTPKNRRKKEQGRKNSSYARGVGPENEIASAATKEEVGSMVRSKNKKKKQISAETEKSPKPSSKKGIFKPGKTNERQGQP